MQSCWSLPYTVEAIGIGEIIPKHGPPPEFTHSKKNPQKNKKQIQKQKQINGGGSGGHAVNLPLETVYSAILMTRYDHLYIHSFHQQPDSAAASQPTFNIGPMSGRC